MSKENKAALKEARELFKENKFTDTIKLCKKILKEEKTNYGALVLLAAAMRDTENLKSQTPVPLKKATEIHPDNPIAWQGLAVFYEKEDDIPQTWLELIPVYCKLLKIESNSSKITNYLSSLERILLQLKDDKVLGKAISELCEAREIFDEVDLIKQMDLTLVSILTQYPKLPNEHDTVLESTLNSILMDGDVSNKHDYYKKYLRVLYKLDKLSLLLIEAAKMHGIFPEDIYPLEWICRVYSEQSITNGHCDGIEITPFYDALFALHAESDLAFFAKAVYLFNIKSLIESRTILNYVVASKSKWIHSWVLLSEINAKLCCWEEAESAAVHAQKILQDNNHSNLQSRVNFTLFEALVKSTCKHKWEEALQKYNQLVPEDSLKRQLLIARAHVNLHDSKGQLLLDELQNNSELKIEVAVLRAIDLKNRGNLEEAADVVGSVLESPEAWLTLGKIHWEMSDFGHSLMAFLKGIHADPYNWECFVYLGNYYIEHGNDVERAKKCYQKALLINPDSEQAGIGLSTAYRLLQSSDENLELLQKLTSQGNGPKWAWLQLGLQLLERNDVSQSIQALRSAIKIDPSDNHSWECLADAYLARGAYTCALRSYQRAFQLNPETFYPLIQLANIKLLIGQHDEAMENFTKVLNENKDNLPALKGLAETHFSIAKNYITKQQFVRARENIQEAVNNLVEAAIIRSDFSCIWKLFGDACYFVAVMPEKFSYLSVAPKVINLESSDDSVIIKREEIFLLAIRCYCRALHLSKESSLLWHDLARCYLAQFSLNPLIDTKTVANKSLAAAKQAVRLSPSTWIHWNLLGVICMTEEIKNYALAQHSFVVAIRKEANNAVSWANLGSLYLHLGDFYKANEAFSWAQRADPAYVNSWIGQGIIAEKLARKEAMDLFRHATQLGYHNQGALGYCHWVLTTLLDPEAKKDDLYVYSIENMHAISVALDEIARYINHFPNDAYARNANGLLLERKKLYRSAIDQFSASLECVSNDSERDAVLVNLSRIMIQLGNYIDSIEVNQKIKTPDFKSHCLLALALFKAERYEESYSSYEVVLQWFAKSGSDKANILCAMAAMASMFQGIDDVKTLLFQCIEIQPPIISGLLAAAALGLLHNDLNLTALVLNELKVYEDHEDYRHHIALLSAYFCLIQNDIVDAIRVVSKFVHKHPGDERLWITLARFLLEIDTRAFRNCAQKGLVLGRKSNSQHTAQIACLKALSDLIDSRGREGTKSVLQAIHSFPANVESWSILIAALLPRCASKDSKPSAHWLTVFSSVIRKSLSNAKNSSKWLLQNEEKASLVADSVAKTYI